MIQVNIKTADQALAYIRGHGFDPVPGVVYNIYKDGCLIANKDDPQRYTGFKGGKKYWNRSCPYHDAVGLQVKYKMCGCGNHKISMRMQGAEYCQECPQSRKLEYQRAYAKRKQQKGSVHWRGDYCKNLRSCKEIKCDSCDGFEGIFQNVDPLVLRENRGVY